LKLRIFNFLLLDRSPFHYERVSGEFTRCLELLTLLPHSQKTVACNNTQKYAETPKQKPQAKTRRRVYEEAHCMSNSLTEPQGIIKKPNGLDPDRGGVHHERV